MATVAEPRYDRYESWLIDLVGESPLLMRALRAARAVGLPDWLIGAGAVRDLVLDRLHGLDAQTKVKDVDLVFFDPHEHDGERERDAVARLRTLEPNIPWDVQNQATVHLWYSRVFGIEVQPLASSADGVGTWPETASAVAVRLDEQERIEVVAPCGLEDLFELRWRRNPRRVTVEEYRTRLMRKRVAERWPLVSVIDG